MENYNPEQYGRRIAEVYDDMYPSIEDVCLDLLTELSKNGRVLELGIGTGRIALPLKARGGNIYGIEISPEMANQLEKKQGGDKIPLTIGDFSAMPVDGSFDLIFVVFNTFFGLTTKELQQKCLENIRLHLTEKGHFLIEAFVPDIARFTDGQSVRATSVRDTEVRLNVAKHDRTTQQICSQHVVITENGIRLYPVTIRYVWPSELDAMATVAGMKLIHRWEDWKKTPFSSRSGRHISVYGRI